MPRRDAGCEVFRGHRQPRLFFTDTGLAALRAMMADRRMADPAKFAHIRRELGIDPAPDGAAQP